MLGQMINFLLISNITGREAAMNTVNDNRYSAFIPWHRSMDHSGRFVQAPPAPDFPSGFYWSGILHFGIDISGDVSQSSGNQSLSPGSFRI
jgi:hypothetical protein